VSLPAAQEINNRHKNTWTRKSQKNGIEKGPVAPDFLDVVNAWTDLKTNPFFSYAYALFTKHHLARFWLSGEKM
jgi:23S rRNA G2069 N7-methylase RlmK/C1962 C5-methylase RlmI